MTQILIFGDSIVYGESDKEQGGWVARLRKFLDSKATETVYWDVYNLGIPGNTSSDLVKRFDKETQARLDEQEEMVIIFAIGINDSQIMLGKNKVSEEVFRNNLQTLLDKARRHTQKVIFVGLTPVDERKTSPLLWDKIKSYKNDQIERYNSVIREHCGENRIPFIDIWAPFHQTDYKRLLEDGLHPNTLGHNLIYQEIKDFFIKKKIILLVED